MNSLPYVSHGYDLPEIQIVSLGCEARYIGIYVLDDEPRIVMSLTNPHFRFGTVENWFPIFQCSMPDGIHLDKDVNDRYFQITYMGIPQELCSHPGLCVRNVYVSSIISIFEGLLPPIER